MKKTIENLYSGNYYLNILIHLASSPFVYGWSLLRHLLKYKETMSGSKMLLLLEFTMFIACLLVVSFVIYFQKQAMSLDSNVAEWFGGWFKITISPIYIFLFILGMVYLVFKIVAAGFNIVAMSRKSKQFYAWLVFNEDTGKSIFNKILDKYGKVTNIDKEKELYNELMKYKDKYMRSLNSSTIEDFTKNHDKKVIDWKEEIYKTFEETYEKLKSDDILENLVTNNKHSTAANVLKSLLQKAYTHTERKKKKIYIEGQNTEGAEGQNTEGADGPVDPAEIELLIIDAPVLDEGIEILAVKPKPVSIRDRFFLQVYQLHVKKHLDSMTSLQQVQSVLDPSTGVDRIIIRFLVYMVIIIAICAMTFYLREMNISGNSVMEAVSNFSLQGYLFMLFLVLLVIIVYCLEKGFFVVFRRTFTSKIWKDYANMMLFEPHTASPFNSKKENKKLNYVDASFLKELRTITIANFKDVLKYVATFYGNPLNIAFIVTLIYVLLTNDMMAKNGSNIDNETNDFNGNNIDDRIEQFIQVLISLSLSLFVLLVVIMAIYLNANPGSTKTGVVQFGITTITVVILLFVMRFKK
jgi:gas vesicle protein